MKTWVRLACSLVGLSLGGGQAGTATGQEGVEALGTPLGAFIVYPSITLGTEYSSNIFREETREEDDLIFTVSPQVRVDSDWDNHLIQFLAAADVVQYADHSDENHYNYRFLSSGRLDILEDTYATANLGVRRDHEERGSPDDVFGAEPTTIETYIAGLGFAHRFSNIWTEWSGEFRYRDFDDVSAVSPATINNDDRDRYELGSSVTVGYDFNPDVAAFAQGGYNSIHYQDAADDSGFSRDSSNYALAGGLRFDITELLRGDVFAGYTMSEFDDPTFDSRGTYDVGADLIWEVTALTTAALTASRTWQETTVAGASTALTTAAGITLNHSLLDTVNLTGEVEYLNQSFEGTSRVDDSVQISPGVQYFMNRFMYWQFAYTYAQRFSNALGEDYIEHAALLSLRLQY